MPRYSQRDFYPASVKSRGLGEVINLSDNLEKSSTLNNGQDSLFSITLTDNKNGKLIGEAEWSLWQTSISSANLIPGGSSVTPSNFQVIGPWFEWTEGALANGIVTNSMPIYNLVSRIYIRNISAGASTVIVARSRVRYLTNLDQIVTTSVVS